MPTVNQLREVSFDVARQLKYTFEGVHVPDPRLAQGGQLNSNKSRFRTPVECPFSTGLFIRLRFEILFLTLEPGTSSVAASEPGTSSAPPPPAAPEPGTAGGWVSEVAAVTSWHP